MKVLKIIVSFSTVIAAIIYGIFMVFQGTTDLYQYMILSLLILIASTFLIMDIQYSNKFEVFFEKFDQLIDTSSVQCFKSVDLCAKEIYHLVKNGEHIVDFVTIDTKIRTANKKKSKLMHKTIQSLFKSNNIKLTYITMFREETAGRFIENIDIGNLHNNNNVYAYFDSDNAIPFATFLVIDNKIVITRTPYTEGQDAAYIIIRNKLLAKHYKDWMLIIWESAKKVETADDINAIYFKIKDNLTEGQKSNLEKHIDNIKRKLEK